MQSSRALLDAARARPLSQARSHAMNGTRMAKKYTAQCACGAVKFEFNTDPDFIANCHCRDCKKASGGQMATFFAVPQDDFTLTSGAPQAHRYIAESGKQL